ncbi:hypothetical protein [Sandaracinus amylolyticus]|uniref:PqqC-like protein n=1 Tax=Sandaracinus amylolyticus TaxID=927083 RepID=A0A0F6W087_9BACT|nr:hypothetical protein [Sandaracinus amylolyticus]AKF04130.1 hypothetical protein DB32_001279 [Sandaracinus amylolyticus]
MKRVLAALDRGSEELARAPLFELLADTRIPARTRLSFAPHVAHFVMSFADLYSHVLSEYPPRDKYQELVNAHAREDETHWTWFLKDLEKLGESPRVPYTDSLRFVWSEQTLKTRMLSYHMCKLGLGASSLQKLVLVQAIEGAGAVTVGRVSAVGREVAAESGIKLVYLGPHHSDTEGEHTLEDDAVRSMIEAIELDDATAAQLVAMVDETYRHFRGFIDEMHALVLEGRKLDATT